MRSLGTFAVVLLGACTSSPQPVNAEPAVRLSVEPTQVRAAGAVTLVLENETPGPIGYNLCTSGLEARNDTGWVAVPVDRICTMELRTAQPGESVRYPTELPAGLAAGEYRFHATVDGLDAGAPGDVRSPAFRVTP